MSEKCFCHLNGLKVKDAEARNMLADGYVTPEMLGYKDGDDCTPYAQHILDHYGNLRLKNKTYNFNGGLTITKTRTNFVCDDGVTINYLGTGDFITIGSTGAYAFYPRFKNLYIFSQNARATIRILGMSGGWFENVNCFHGETGFAFNEDADKPYHMITSAFIKCGSYNHTKNGFEFLSEWTHQVNDISMIECSANENEYFGFNIGGNSVNVVGGNAEGNGYGFGFNGVCNGVNVTGTYTEKNAEYDWFLPIEDDAKKNICVTNTYDLDLRIYSEYNKYKALYHRNIQLLESKSDFLMNAFSKSVKIAENEPVSSALLMILGNKIKTGTKISMKISSGDISGSMHLAKYAVIDGIPYALWSNVEVKQIVSVDNGVCTFDSPVENAVNYSMLFNDSICSKFMTVDEVRENGVFISPDRDIAFYSKGNHRYAYEKQLTAGTDSAVLPYDVSVGDYIVIGNDRDYWAWNIHPTQLGAIKTTTLTMNTENIPSIIADNIAPRVIALGNIERAVFDFISVN